MFIFPLKKIQISLSRLAYKSGILSIFAKESLLNPFQYRELYRLIKYASLEWEILKLERTMFM